MNEYVLSCCSTADMTREYFERRNIAFVPFHYFIDGHEYLDDFGESLPYRELYRLMAEGKETRTAQVNIQEYLEHFSKILEKGMDVVHISLSSGLSGTFCSAKNAALIAEERFPGRKVYIVDSLCSSSGYGLFMDKLADLRDKGLTAKELCRWAEDNKMRMRHWFFSTDLSAYIRGGRISKQAGLVGTILGICPLLHMDNAGKLIPMEKVRCKKKVINRITEKMMEEIEDGAEYSEKVFICHSECYADAEAVAEKVKKLLPKMDGEPQIYNVGTTIGSHTGQGTVALFFWSDKNDRG